MNKIVFVLGMHRTGSSLLTSVLNDLDFNPGNDLLVGDMYNVDGYWEYKPLLDLHERMLADYDNQWFAPGHHMPLDELLLHYRAEAESLIQMMDLEKRDWCWKDPRLVLFLDFWLEILADRSIKWIITHRHPASIARSLESRNHFDIETGLKLWEYSMIQLLSRKDRLTDSITIPYEEMLSDPKKQINRIAAFLQPQWDEETLDEHSKAATLRINTVAIHHRDHSEVVLSVQQKKLEKWIREGDDLKGPSGSGSIMSGHRRYFRKLLRDIPIEQEKRMKELENTLESHKHKMVELQQIIHTQNQQMAEMDTVRYFIRKRSALMKSSLRRLSKCNK